MTFTNKTTPVVLVGFWGCAVLASVWSLRSGDSYGAALMAFAAFVLAAITAVWSAMSGGYIGGGA